MSSPRLGGTFAPPETLVGGRHDVPTGVGREIWVTSARVEVVEEQARHTATWARIGVPAVATTGTTT